MEINEYQNKIRDWIDYPAELGPFSVILSLQNNVGNLANKLNNALINDHGNFTKENRMKTAISLGDILFDISNIATDLGYSMNDIISLNLMKHNTKPQSDDNIKSK